MCMHMHMHMYMCMHMQMVRRCRLERGGPLIKRCRASYSGGENSVSEILEPHKRCHRAGKHVYPCMAVRCRLCVLRGARGGVTINR